VQAVREVSRLGTAPHRKGRPFNRAEYDALKTEAMLDMLDPGRPRALDGAFLSEKAAADVRAIDHYALHPEMQACDPWSVADVSGQ
jgi:hypothetical protein